MKAYRMFTVSALAAALFYTNSATAAVPPVETKGTAAVCPTTLSAQRLFHFDKVVFMIIGQTGQISLIAANPDDQPRLNQIPVNTELDIKITDNPRAVASLKHKVLTFLGAATNAENASRIKILEVEYAVVLCPKVP